MGPYPQEVLPLMASSPPELYAKSNV